MHQTTKNPPKRAWICRRERGSDAGVLPYDGFGLNIDAPDADLFRMAPNAALSRKTTSEQLAERPCPMLTSVGNRVMLRRVGKRKFRQATQPLQKVIQMISAEDLMTDGSAARAGNKRFEDTVAIEDLNLPLAGVDVRQTIRQGHRGLEGVDQTHRPFDLEHHVAQSRLRYRLGDFTHLFQEAGQARPFYPNFGRQALQVVKPSFGDL